MLIRGTNNPITNVRIIVPEKINFRYFIKKFLQDEGIIHQDIPTPALPGSGTVDSSIRVLSAGFTQLPQLIYSFYVILTIIIYTILSLLNL